MVYKAPLVLMGNILSQRGWVKPRTAIGKLILTKHTKLSSGVESLFVIAGEELVDDPIFFLLPKEQQEILTQVVNDPSHPAHEKRRWHLEMDEETKLINRENLSKIKKMKQDEFDKFIASREFGYKGRPEKFIDDKVIWFQRIYESEKNDRIPNIAVNVFIVIAIIFGAMSVFLD